MIILDFFKESINLWLEISFYLVVGIIIAGFIHIFLGKDFIRNQLGRPTITSIVKAVIFGIPLPVCSCGVIPLASSLQKEGAHKSSVLSFLVSTPTTGADSILATYSLLGPLFAIFRPLGAFICGVSLGLLDYLFEGRKEKVKFIPKRPHLKISNFFKFKEFLRYTFVEIPQDMGKWLIISTLIGGGISVFIPKEIFTNYLFFPLDFLIVILVGIPLYVCATGSIPIGASLLAKGISGGAVLLFLIVGPATNIITLSFIRARMGRKSFYLYLINIIIVAVILSLIFNHLWIILGKKSIFIKGGSKILPFYIKMISGIFLFLIILNSSRFRKIFEPDYQIYVPDIHCQQCKITLEEKLKKLEGVKKVVVDVEEKMIRLKGDVEKEKIIKKIKESGYLKET
jgi:hypothetical protein